MQFLKQRSDDFVFDLTFMSLDDVTINLPSVKNKVSAGEIDGALRSPPAPSYCVMCDSAVFALACCE